MGYGYEFGYMEPAAEGIIAGVGGFMLVFMILFYVIMFAMWVAIYVLWALGLYSIAKRRGIHNPWLSWLPIGDMWILGSISDQYQFVAKGKVRNRRKVLVGLGIGLFATLFLIIGSALVGIISEVSGVMDGEAVLGAMLAVVLLSYFAMMVLTIVLAVFQYIALYDLYHSADPNNAVLYLILSIFFNITVYFFLFFNRKKDLGMPPRKQPEPVQPVYQPIVEPVIMEASAVTEAPVAEEAPVVGETPVVEEVPVVGEEAPAAEETDEQPE